MLLIGVIGYNLEQTYCAIREIAKNDMDSTVKRMSKSEIGMSDGCVYRAITDLRQLGSRYDQIIIADDYRANVYENRRMLIIKAMSKLSESFQGMECQIQDYVW